MVTSWTKEASRSSLSLVTPNAYSSHLQVLKPGDLLLITCQNLLLIFSHLHQFLGRTVRQQHDILQRHRITLSDEEMSEFTEIFKVIYCLIQGMV